MNSCSITLLFPATFYDQEAVTVTTNHDHKHKERDVNEKKGEGAADTYHCGSLVGEERRR
jgi:hypothetical protein